MSRPVRSTLVVLLLLAPWSGVLLPAAPASAAPRAGTWTIHRSAAFHTAGQSLWGRGGSRALTATVPIFDKSWNESGSAGSITEVVGLKFGAALEGSTTGEVGLSAAYSLGAGNLAIDYPVQVTFKMPSSFQPGAWATIGTALDVLPGAKITSATPQGHIDLNGVFGFHAHGGGDLCFITCVDPKPSADVTIPTSTGRIFRIDDTVLHDFTALELDELGLSGFVKLPHIKAGHTTVNHDHSLSASGSDEYAELGISAIDWGLKLAGIELPLNEDLPSCCGISAGYTTFDSSYTATATASQALTFRPQVAVTLKLPRTMRYVVHGPTGQVVARGQSDEVVVPAGGHVSLLVPANQTGALKIVPSAFIPKPMLTNRVTTDITFGGEVEALEAHATIPADDPWFPGVDVTLGPVYDETYPLGALPTIDVWSGRWGLAGFHRVAMDAFAIPHA